MLDALWIGLSHHMQSQAGRDLVDAEGADPNPQVCIDRGLCSPTYTWIANTSWV